MALQKISLAFRIVCILCIFQSVGGQTLERNRPKPHAGRVLPNRSKSKTRAMLKGEIGQFTPTFYRILDQDAREWPDEPATEELGGCNGETIASVTPTFKHQLDIEGSGRLHGGRIVNTGGTRNNQPCWLEPKTAPFGLGEDGLGLIPYRSLAVDPKVVKLGSVLYIPALDGVRLPNGELHDGFVIAHDTGTAIGGYRIDVFVGFEDDVDNSLTQSGQIENLEPLAVYQVDDQTAGELRQELESDLLSLR